MLRIRNSGRPNSAGDQPMAASCDQPNKSPLGRVRSMSSVKGRAPAAPAAVVCTSNNDVIARVKPIAHRHAHIARPSWPHESHTSATSALPPDQP